MDVHSKHTDVTPRESESRVPLTNEEADKRLKNMIDKNGGIKNWNLPYHN